MDKADYLALRTAIVESGYGGDIEWAQTVGAPTSADLFVREYIFVVCNSGMLAQIARVIYSKVISALEAGMHPTSVFGHAGKSAGIWAVWSDREVWFSRFNEAADKVAFLESMPWIGPITKWHLAKNFGLDVAKPDRHLVRVAERYQTTPKLLCDAIAQATGDRVGTVDYVIWRACNLGLINSRELGGGNHAGT